MGKKKYTVLVFSQQASKVREFILSPLTLKVGAAVLVLLLGVSGYLLFNYLTYYPTYQKKVQDLRELRKEMISQQAEIQSFLEKISWLEKQLSRLRGIEEQVKKELQEVQELKKEKNVKNIKKLPRPPVSSTRTPEPSKAADSKPENASFRGDQVSILERERPRLVSRIHVELLDLTQEAFHRQQILKELQAFLQSQKTVLLSIPSLWPVLGRITSSFGDTRLNSSSGGKRPHLGVDIGASRGTPVVAPADGTVSSAGREAEYGRLVCLDHGHGFTTLFGHLKKISVKAGDRVKRGQTIGAVGTSGNTTGPHLHYEVRINGRPVNPTPYLNRKYNFPFP